MSELKDSNGLTEEEYLKTYDSDAWKKPSVTADIGIIAREGGEAAILLIKRGNHPFIGKWAFPGGFSEEGERMEETAARELVEETGVDIPARDLTLVGVYSKAGRDPRGWTVSAAYLAVVEMSEVSPKAADDATDAAWFTIVNDSGHVRLKNGELELEPEDLAFDHEDILSDTIEKYREIAK